MKPYGLGTFSHAHDGRKFVGLVVDDHVADVAKLAGFHDAPALASAGSVLTLLDAWETNCAALDRLALAIDGKTEHWYPLDALRVHPAVDLPRQIFCTGANYRKHVVDMTVDARVGPPGLDEAGLRRWAENMMDERAATGEPYAFTKPVSTVSGAYDPLVLPNTTTQPDWELELAVVIGRGGYQIQRELALDHVAGYCIVNDISARDLIPRTDYKMLGTDWLRSKGQPGFLPLGPYLVPKAFVADPHRLKMRLSVSGQVMQDESTADMLFGIERQIEYISRYSRLLPGDIVCTGSPAGNGTHYNRYLRAGDVIEAEIEGLGRQRQVCV
ncbi:fumarylacetoacetate hydrolase family protein [Paraburkholderia sp. MM5384-R2]|uniref:fumarylacetoacetate hydrolase family protein n=1 Tax=Paraburkholderia sp. MM5384-R2 TaxID=2723097 RepID=UPI001614D987|nr:fumarylacetoacetate hydrolase family protein [Paraburkholderia sp. MM5384-R2]MBB5497585.1 2-keto-4-pentenoate hydratase/2-oxohepta-3-ene-1,7-dioic acid hydratase in catechol pathway [Paraburkholderia sp. MM5384-R2]